MKFEQFKATVGDEQAPAGITASLTALWYAGKGDWEQAHNMAQDISTREGSWVHAYLHRVEGDESNANYWYKKAGRTMPALSLEEEWAEIVKALL